MKSSYRIFPAANPEPLGTTGPPSIRTHTMARRTPARAITSAGVAPRPRLTDSKAGCWTNSGSTGNIPDGWEQMGRAAAMMFNPYARACAAAVAWSLRHSSVHGWEFEAMNPLHWFGAASEEPRPALPLSPPPSRIVQITSSGTMLFALCEDGMCGAPKCGGRSGSLPWNHDHRPLEHTMRAVAR